MTVDEELKKIADALKEEFEQPTLDFYESVESDPVSTLEHDAEKYLKKVKVEWGIIPQS